MAGESGAGINRCTDVERVGRRLRGNEALSNRAEVL